MSLLRATARTLLATYFVASGIKAIKDPAALVPAAEPLADKVMPLVKQYAPDQVADYVPQDAKTLVRLNGAAEIVGGVALATGFGRRLGALLLAGTLIPSTIAKYPFWTRQDAEQRADERSHFLKNASLLGGVLLASVDTEGKPSLAYRAQKGGQAIAKDTKKAGRKVAKSTNALTEAALAEGVALAGAVVAQSRRAKKQAAKQAAQTRKAAEKAAKPALKQARGTAKDAQKKIEKAQKQAGKTVGGLTDQAVAKVAEVKTEGAKQTKGAKQAASDMASHITLGEN